MPAACTCTGQQHTHLFGKCGGTELLPILALGGLTQAACRKLFDRKLAILARLVFHGKPHRQGTVAAAAAAAIA